MKHPEVFTEADERQQQADKVVWRSQFVARKNLLQTKKKKHLTQKKNKKNCILGEDAA